MTNSIHPPNEHYRLPRQQLIPQNLAEHIPRLRATAGKAASEIDVHVHLFVVGMDMDWYVTEYDQKEQVALCWVQYGQTTEVDYYSIREMESVEHPSLPVKAIERDILWKPTKLSDIAQLRLPEWVKQPQDAELSHDDILAAMYDDADDAMREAEFDAQQEDLEGPGF